MRLAYEDGEDPKLAYLYLLNPGEHPIVRTVQVGSESLVMADLDADGRVVGIEVIDWQGAVEISGPES